MTIDRSARRPLGGVGVAILLAACSSKTDVEHRGVLDDAGGAQATGSSGGATGAGGRGADSGGRAGGSGAPGSAGSAGQSHLDGGLEPPDASQDAGPAPPEASTDACAHGHGPVHLADATAGYLVPWGDRLYFGVFSPPDLGAATAIGSVSTCGGPVSTLAPVFGVRSFAVADTGVYYVEGSPHDAGFTWQLMTIPLAGGAAAPIGAAPTAPTFTIVTEDRVFFGGEYPPGGPNWVSLKGAVDGGSDHGTFEEGSVTFSMAADDRYLYWQSYTLGLVREPIAGGAVEPVAGGKSGPVCRALAVRGRYLYCGSYGISALGRFSLTDPAEPPLTIYDNVVGRIVTDDQFVYWVQPNTNSISRANLDGSNVTTLVVAPGIVDMVVDADAVYWSQWGDVDGSTSGSIWKIEK